MRFPLPLLALCLGCTHVYGTIDGEEVPVSSTFYAESERYFGNDGLIVVYLGYAEGGCEMMSAFLEDMDDADGGSERVDVWEEYMPEDFWDIRLMIRVDDPDDEMAGVQLDGADWDTILGDDDEISVTARHYTDYPTENSFTWWGWVTGEVADYYDTYVSDDGEGEINAYDPGAHIRGSFSTEMVDEDGDSEGEVTYNFSANRCRDIEDYVF